MASPDDVARAFVGHFYMLFDSNRAGLAGLFQDSSMLSFEGKPFLGQAQIMQQLNTLGAAVAHKPVTIDAQPTFNGGVLVFVSGDLSIDGGNPIKFSEVFHLLPIPGTSGYWCYNDMFRLNYG